MYDYHFTTANARSAIGPTKACARRRIVPGLCLLGALMLSSATFGAMGATANSVPAPFDTRGKITLLTVQAVGVQIYDCRADDAGRLTWRFREPLAILMTNGQTVGRHFAGPSWQLNDGGKVVGEVVAQKPGATDKDIALLELNVAGNEGTGVLSRVTTVERLNTRGGSFVGTCDQAGGLHAEPYSAQYSFLGN